MTRFVIAPALFALMAFATPAHAQQAPANPPHDHAHSAAPAPPAASAHDMHDMHNMHMQTMDAMKTADAKLDDLVAKMNAATGAARIDAMAAVLNALIEERRATAPAMHHMMQMMQMMDTMHQPAGADVHQHDATPRE